MLFRSVLARIQPFFGTHTDSTIFSYSPGEFFDTRTDSTFPSTPPDSIIFRYSLGFYHFSVLTDSTRFRYWRGQFFDTRTNSTFSRYSPGFNHFSVLTQIRPFSLTHRESFSILVRILAIPGTRPDSTIFRHSHRFDPFRVLVGRVFRYSYRFYLPEYSAGFYHFSVLTQIRPFFGTRGDSFSILVRILPFPGTRPDSTIFQYSHRFVPVLMLVEIVFRY